MKKWINLKDRPPLVGEKVIVLLEDGLVEATFLGSEIVGAWALPEGGVVKVRDAKWMPVDNAEEADA